MSRALAPRLPPVKAYGHRLNLFPGDREQDPGPDLVFPVTSSRSAPRKALRQSGLRVHNWAFIHHEFYLYRKRIQQEAKFKMTGRMREPNLEKSTLDGANTLRYSCQAMSILMDVPSRAARTDVFRYFA